MAETVAEQVQGDQGVDPGRLDPAPAAILLLTGDDPVGAAAQCGAAHRPHRPGPLATALEHVQDAVQPAESEFPAGPVRGLSRLAGPVARLILAGCPDLVQAEGEGPDRPERAHHGQRHDRLPRPAGPVVHIKREPGGQVHHFGRHDRQVVPRPLAEEGEPDPGEHPRGGDAAARADPLGCPGHVGCAGQMPRQPQGNVGLDGGGQVTGSAEIVGPGSVGPLLGGDPPAGGGGLLLRPDAEELTQEQVLSVHRDVGFQLPLPPALVMLEAEQVVTGAGQRGLRAGER